MASEKFPLSVADYVIFALMLVVSAGTGIFFQLTSKRKTNEEYLLAGKDMSILPVAFSLMATQMSATTLMGIPAEMYLYGTNMALMNIGYIIGLTITSHVFLPIYFANDISTVYEYLEKRFGKMTRKITSAMFAVQTVLFTCVTLYAPALALGAVTSLPIWMSVMSVGLVSTFYCTLGGMKAVIWTDFFQVVLMFFCPFAVIVQGCWLLGGLENVFEIADAGGRLFLPKFSFDLGAHYTMINVVAQGTIITMSSYVGGQVQVQRLMTLRNLTRSRIAIFINMPLLVSFHLLCCLSGLVLYAYFKHCDPVTSPNTPIHSADQLLPYFITTALGHLPGIPGLCICGIFSASFSTVSSSLNSLASIATEDFIRPLFPDISVTSFHAQVMSLLFGILCVALAFAVASLGNLVKLSLIVLGNLAGPNLAVFLLASCTTTANEEGVILGFVTSIVLAFCLSFLPVMKTDPFLPLSNECNSLELKNTSFASESSNFRNYSNSIYSDAKAMTLSATPRDEENSILISYMWVSTIAMNVCLVVGYLGSFIIAFLRGKSEEVPDIYLSPIRNRFTRKNLNKLRKEELKRNSKDESEI